MCSDVEHACAVPCLPAEDTRPPKAETHFTKQKTTSTPICF